MAHFGKSWRFAWRQGFWRPVWLCLHMRQAAKKITSISLSIKADIQPDTDYGEESIEIESSSNRYNVDGYEVMNEALAGRRIRCQRSESP